MNLLCCGRIDDHPPHYWTRPRDIDDRRLGWDAPTFRCDGTPRIEGGHHAD